MGSLGLQQSQLPPYHEAYHESSSFTARLRHTRYIHIPGGLLFIAATKDAKIRAFHVDTGEQLWEANLPAGGYATPATYLWGGRQYLVIACGGGKMETPSGDMYVAFALE